ncbi:MAG: polysaccharide biosynthesis tyrosine autokinase [Chloroflexi bacterium]|nr:polysaccharide biosynthesis tyrosine autokinase [Chloroflexota bacterium]
MTAPPKGQASIGPLVTLEHPRSPAAEAYRTLRANLRFSSLDLPAKSILFTSPGQQEGKTTTLANLAVIASQAGSKVIVVDCDLRRPSLHRIFGLPNSTGFTDFLLGDARDRIPTQDGPTPGLRVLTSGPLPPNPAELLSLDRVDTLLAALREEADLILLDSPPAAVVADASILAPRVDGVVLVIDATRTRREPARRAKEQLERVKARLLGVVVNRAHLDSGTSQYYQ